MARKPVLVVVGLLALVLLSACNLGEPPLGTAGNPIVMSFVPAGDAQSMVTSGDELAALLSERTGLTIEANVGTDFAAVREAMCAGRAHIGWLNPFNYLLANEVCGVDAALVTTRFGEPFYTGQINVRADSGIETLDDLRGKTMCWVDSNSTSGYIIPRIMLAANGFDPDTDFANSMMAGTHNNVITQVYNGECDAGASYAHAIGAVAEQIPDVSEQVIVIARTAEIPNDNVSFTTDFPEALRKEIIQALLDIAASEEGQQVLQTLSSIEGLQTTEDSFYDAFRAELSRSGIDIEELAQ